jgi:hypothetical protein
VGNFDEPVLNAFLDAFARNVSYGLNTQVFVKLHTGDPGGTGASNAATETNRKQATFGTPAATGAISNTVAVEWTNVSTNETISWISLWSAATAGTFLGNDQLTTAATLATGDTFRIPIGDLDLTLTSGI